MVAAAGRASRTQGPKRSAKKWADKQKKSQAGEFELSSGGTINTSNALSADGAGATLTATSVFRTLSFTCIQGQPCWLLNLVEWELAGYRVISSLVGLEKSFLIAPNLEAFQIQRASNHSWTLRGYMDAAGRMVCGGAIPHGTLTVELLLDSCATVNVAGPRWRDMLANVNTSGRAVRGVGDKVTASDGSGTMDIYLVSPSHDIDPTLLALMFNTVSVAYAADATTVASIDDAPLPSSKDTTSKARRQRNSSGTALTGDQVCQRLGFLQVQGSPHTHEHYIGMSPFKTTAQGNSIREEMAVLASMRKRRRHHEVTAESRANAALRATGYLWHFDLLPSMGSSIGDGFVSALVMVEARTGFIMVIPLKVKTSEAVIAAIERVRVFNDSSGNSKMGELRGDFDSSLAVAGRGDDIDTAALKLYKETHNITNRHSPPGAQALNRAEPMMGRLFHMMNYNLVNAGFTTLAWWDMFSAAAAQLNMAPPPVARRVGGSLTSVYELYHRRKPDASRWIGYPGQGCFVHIPGSKANRGAFKAEPGYFVMPSDRTAGFIVRLYRTFESSSHYDVRMVHDPNLRQARLMLSEQLNRQHADAAVAPAVIAAAVRALHVAHPLPHLPNDLTMTLAVVDPLTKMPLKLFPALDEDGEVTMLPQHACSDDGENLCQDSSLPPPNPTPPNPTLSPHPASPNPTPSPLPQQQWTPHPHSKQRPQPSAHIIKSLPHDTPIRFDPSTTKGKKSGLRFKKYCTATTIGALQHLNPQFYMADAQFDISKGHLSVKGLLFINDTYSFTSSSTPTVFHVLQPPAFCYNAWPEAAPEEVQANVEDDAYQPESSGAASHTGDGPWLNFADVLEEDLLLPVGGASQAAAHVREYQALRHASGMSECADLAGLEATFAELMKQEAAEGAPAPHIVSNDTADMHVMDIFELQDQLDGFETVHFATVDSVFAAAAAGASTTPSSTDPARKAMDDMNFVLRQALRSEWREEVRAAHAKDVKLMVDSKAIRLVPYSALHAAIAKWGKDRVSLRHIVYACKVKKNAKGEITQIKVRGCVGDATRFGKVPDTYSATVAPSSRRLLAQLMAMYPDATSAQNDVRGAYYCGKPVPPEEGGRCLFCFIPPEMEEYGFPQYDENGQRNLLEIIGNIPGRQEAGKIWGEEYTRFLVKECGMVQSQVDRRLFHRKDESGNFIITAVYVDDSWFISTSPVLQEEFSTKWHARYTTASDVEATEGEFCGVLIERKEDKSVVLRGERLFDDLAKMVADHPLPQGFTAAYPMASAGLKLMHSPVSASNPLMSTQHHDLARSIVGLGGFIACNVRPDAYFAFVAITQHIGQHFTLQVWKAVLRWAHYLLRSRSCSLTYRHVDHQQWCCYSDSALANLPNGGTFGGYTFGLDALTAIIDWRCLVPRSFPDSSAAAELIIATYASKSILGFRMLFAELDLLPPGPTTLYIDASAVINGAEMEKITKQMRFMAARYSMLRVVVEDGKVRLCKCDSEENKSDGFTKPLTGEPFRRWRAMVLGLHFF